MALERGVTVFGGRGPWKWSKSVCHHQMSSYESGVGVSLVGVYIGLSGTYTQ